MKLDKYYLICSMVMINTMVFSAMPFFSKVTYAQDKKADTQKKLYEAMRLKDEEDVAGAIKLIKEILAQDPKNVAALVSLGTMYVANNDYISAQKNIDVALSIDPQSSYALRSKADVLMLQGEYQEAEQCLNKAIEFSTPKSSDSAYAYYGLAQLYLKQGMEEKAKASLEKALEESPQNPDFIKAMQAIKGTAPEVQ